MTLSTEQGPSPDLDEALDTYVDLLGRAAMSEAVRLVTDLSRSGVPLERIVERVLGPAQVEVGYRWQTGSWSVAQEHTATGITEIALQSAVLAASERPPTGDVRLVLACAEGEWHALSARMACDVLGHRGVDVIYAGASLPGDALGDYLELNRPTALGLSCSTALTLVGARESIAEAHRVRVPVMVAGAAFGSTSRRADAIGADAWSSSLDEAVRVLEAWAADPPTRFATAIEPVSDEWRRLADAPSEWVDEVMAGLAKRRPRLAAFSQPLLARLKKEVAYLMRICAGAVLCDDPDMLADYSRWMHGVLRSREVPSDVVDEMYASLVQVLMARAPRSAESMERARVGMRPS